MHKLYKGYRHAMNFHKHFDKWTTGNKNVFRLL